MPLSKWNNALVVLLAGSLSLAFTAMPAPAAVPAGGTIKAWYVPGELVVKYKRAARLELIAQALKSVDAREQHVIGGDSRFALVKLPQAADVQAAVRRLQASGQVEYAEPNYIHHEQAFTIKTTGLANCTHVGYALAPAACVYPDDPNAVWPLVGVQGYEWYMENLGATSSTGTLHADIGLTAAWGLLCNPVSNACGNAAGPAATTDFVVAVIDDGFDLTNPDLTANFMSNGADCSGSSCSGTAIATATDGSQDHGTYVSSTLGAVGGNGTAIAGVTWHAKILPIKSDLTSASVIAGINYAIAHNANVINESFGGPIPSQAEYDALTTAQSHGILVVVSAGNSNSDNDRAGAAFPANYAAETVVFPAVDGTGDPIAGATSSKPGLPNVLAVGASDFTDNLTSFSEWGAFDVGLLAPGSNIVALQRGANGGTTVVAGTSFSAPLTAGSAALVAEYLFSNGQHTVDWHDLKAHLLNGGEVSQASGTDPFFGRSSAGRLNTYLAMQPVDHGVILVRNVTIDDSAGNGDGDGEIDPGESDNLDIHLANIGPDESDVTATLSYLSPTGLATVVPATATQHSGAMDSPGPDQDATATLSFPVQFSNSLSGNQSLLFQLDITPASGGHNIRTFYLEAGALSNGVTVIGTLSRNAYDYYQAYHIDVPAGARNLVLTTTTPNGEDIDLLAEKNSAPQYLQPVGFLPTDPSLSEQYVEPNAQLSGRSDGDESIDYDGLPSLFTASAPPQTAAGTYHLVVVNFNGNRDQPYTLTACYAPSGSDQITFAANDIVGEDAGTVSLTLLRSGSTNAVSVHYATSDGDSQGDPMAKAGTNYTATSGIMNWAAGDGTDKIITVPITDTKSIAQGTNGVSFLHFTVTLSGITGGAAIGCLPQDNVAIVNPDNSPAGPAPAPTPTPTPTPSPSGKSGGGVFDLFSLLAVGVGTLRCRRRYPAKPA